MDFFFICSTATNVEIEVPVPLDATNPNIRTSMGSASYAPERDAMVWKVKSFPGGKVTINMFPN
jgi:AP-1 complex subunit mu